MPSDLERAVSAYRDDLDRLDAAAEGRLLRAYDSAKTNILQRVNDLAPAITDGTASPGAVYQDARYRALLDDIEREVAGFARTTGQVVASGQGQAVAMAGEQAAGLVAAQAPRVAAGFARVPVGALTEMVGVLGDGSPLASLLDTYGPQARAAAGPILTNAVTTGASPLQIAGNLADALDVLQWRAERLARTEMLRAFRNAALRNYQANAHLLRGWRWLCAKSQRTCFACLAMDGRIFPLARPMAEHIQGRCTQIPLVRGYPDPDIETGAAWFARQTPATQQAMFAASGKKALYEPYKAGRLGLDDMVTYQDDARWGGAFSEASAKASLSNAGRTSIPGLADDAARVADDVPTFRPATTIGEAEDFARTLGVESVDYGTRLDLANIANEAIADQASNGRFIPKSVRVMKLRGQSANAPAVYDLRDRTIKLNTGSTKQDGTLFWDDPEGNIKAMRDAEWFVADRPSRLVTHEIGHAAHHVHSPADLSPSGLYSLGGEQGRVARSQVSHYAATETAELVAEVYTGITQGITYSDEVMALYRKFGGPPV